MRPLRTHTAVKKICLASNRIKFNYILWSLSGTHAGWQAGRHAGNQLGRLPFFAGNGNKLAKRRTQADNWHSTHSHVCVGLKKRWVKVWKHFWFIKNLKSSKCFQTRPVVYGSKATYIRFFYLAWKHLQLQLNRWVCHSSICKVLKCQMKWWCEFCGPKLKDWTQEDWVQRFSILPVSQI